MASGAPGVNKVFCIGFNKTGTSSMHRLFTELGITSFHGYYSHIPVTDPLYREYQCFSDGDQHDYALFDRSFPGSRFILTTHPLNDWLVSRIRHVEQRRRIGATGPMRQEYEAVPALALRRWVECRLDYHGKVAAYFAFLGLTPREGLTLPHENALRPDAPADGVRSKAEVQAEVGAALRDLGMPPVQLAAVFP